MSAQYDAIAAEYQRTKESPLRRYVEAYSFMRMLGSVSGMRVLDLACGDGYYTRLIKAAGAAEVIGVDVSAEMIGLAQSIEADAPQGIEYHCADAAALPELGGFDLVSAAYLFHYASDRVELDAMCGEVARVLKPGGRLVAINENPLQASESYAGYTQYGFNKSVDLPREEGSAIHYAMVSGRSLIRFDAYYYSQPVYEAALTAAGFTAIDWPALELDPAGMAETGADYFQEYLDNPPVTGLTCVRAAQGQSSDA